MDGFLPPSFAARMKALLGADYPAFSEELEKDAPVHALRVNIGKIAPEALLPLLPGVHTPIPYAPDGFLTTLEKPGTLPVHHAGAFYMQDPSAMSTVHAVTVREGETILDCCAAPGGKTTQLSAYAGERGVVVANEFVPSRCRILQGNIERMGCRNTVVTNLSLPELSRLYPECFSLVVADAPCSGEGMFRKNALAISEWSEENVEMCAARQRMILSHAARCVAPGGTLLYSTCTFSPAENEENVIAFLDAHPDFSLVGVNPALLAHTAPGLPLSDRCDLTLTRRFYPHLSPGEGQYVAVLRREGELTLPTMPAPAFSLSREDAKIAAAFLGETLTVQPDLPLFRYRDTLFFRPCAALPDHGVFGCGVPLGSIRKDRIEPHHALFSAYGQYFARRIELPPDSAEAYAYLHGLTLPAESENGWCAVTVAACPLGGGKIASGILKNHYPKGLRQS